MIIIQKIICFQIARKTRIIFQIMFGLTTQMGSFGAKVIRRIKSSKVSTFRKKVSKRVIPKIKCVMLRLFQKLNRLELPPFRKLPSTISAKRTKK